MKSFKQHINEGNIEHYGDKNDVNFFDGSEKSMQVMSAYLGSISEREFMNPDAGVHQIYNKLWYEIEFWTFSNIFELLITKNVT